MGSDGNALETNRIVLSSDGKILQVMNYDLDINVGDISSVFKGSSFPTLLRPLPAMHGDRFTLLSLCHDWLNRNIEAWTFDEQFFASQKTETFCLV